MITSLNDFFKISNLDEYNVYYASKPSNEKHPFDALKTAPEFWADWHGTHPERKKFSKPFIFSLAPIPRGKRRGDWLFGGILEIHNRSDEDCYQIVLTDQLRDLIGRLLIIPPSDFKIVKNKNIIPMEEYYKEEIGRGIFLFEEISDCMVGWNTENPSGIDFENN